MAIAENLLDRLRKFRQEIALRESIAVIPERKSVLRMALADFDREFPETKTHAAYMRAWDAARREDAPLRQALQEVMQALGPDAPTCGTCSGCHAEISMALESVRAVGIVYRSRKNRQKERS